MTAAILDYCLTWAFAGQLIAAGFALSGQWFVGNKSTWGPALGICGQIAWTVMIVLNGTYGLLLSNIPMYFVQVRNLRKWRRQRPRRAQAQRLTVLAKDGGLVDWVAAARGMGC